MQKLIQNKNVCFVGPAPTLINQGMGSEIDNYDIVIRSNNAINLLWDENYIRDYGKRCDILYINVQFARESIPFLIGSWIKKGLKFICSKNGDSISEYKKYFGIRNLSNIVEEIKKHNSSAIMGNIIIVDLLNMKPEKLYLTGMDFFESVPEKFLPGNYPQYYPGYLPENIMRQGDMINIAKNEHPDLNHNWEMNKNAIIKLIKENACIKVDKFMQKIIEAQ